MTSGTQLLNGIFGFLIDRAILVTVLAVVAVIGLWGLIGSRPL